MVAGEPHEAAAAVATLSKLDRSTWRAVEPSVVALLSKVRGEAHTQVCELLVRQGTLERTRAATRSFDPVRRARAAHLLGQAGHRVARPDLERMLRDRDEDVRRVSAAALGHLGDPRSTTPLLRTLAARRPVPASVVASAVAELGQWAHASLFSAIGDESPLCGRSRSRSAAWPVPCRPRRCCGQPCVTTARSRCASGPPAPLAGSASRTPSPTWWPPAAPSSPPRCAWWRPGRWGTSVQPQAVPGLRRMLGAPEHRVAANAAAALARLGGYGVAALREVAAEGGRAGLEARAGLALVDLSARAAAIAAAAHAPAVPA